MRWGPASRKAVGRPNPGRGMASLWTQTLNARRGKDYLADVSVPISPHLITNAMSSQQVPRLARRGFSRAHLQATVRWWARETSAVYTDGRLQTTRRFSLWFWFCKHSVPQ